MRHWCSRRLAATALVAVALTGVASAGGWQLIRIHWGDTLTGIAKRYHTSPALLARVNHLPGNGNLIYAGNTLLVPAPRATHRGAARTHTVVYRHRVVLGDYLFQIAAAYPVSP